VEKKILGWAFCIIQLLAGTTLLGVEGEPEEVHFFVRKNNHSNEFIGRQGVLVKRNDAPATILLLHGYGVDKYYMGPFRLLLRDYNCLTFDFRAHGEHSDDEESTLGHDEVYDIFGAVDFVNSDPDLKDKPLIVVGFSMGAVSAIEAQSIDSSLFVGMFLDTPFSSSADVLRRGMQGMKFDLLGYEFDMPGRSLLERYAFNPYVQSFLKMLLRFKTSLNATRINTVIKAISPSESIKKINIPAFFVVTEGDQKVSVSDVKTVYDNHPGPKDMWVASGRHHCDAILYNPEKYEKIINKFIQNVLSGNKIGQ
jgi:pimeloyl-ACP methyl ester carboxylesterase